MIGPVTINDAIALLERSALPTVLTEGATDYQVMRRMEKRLSDVGIDFLPLSGKSSVLEVWNGLSNRRKEITIAFVDLDDWLYIGVPQEFQSNMILCTFGYSIENDIFLDSNLIELCDDEEADQFAIDIDLVAEWHARAIEAICQGQNHPLDIHANQIIAAAPVTPQLTDMECDRKEFILSNYGKNLRGKTLFQTLSRQLNRQGREVKFSYRHLYEIGSLRFSHIFERHENGIRVALDL